MNKGMTVGIAQRRAARALRRKAVVRAKRASEQTLSNGAVNAEPWIAAGEVPPGKASAALMDVAAPLTDEIDEDDKNAYHNCLMMGMIAWNLSLIPSEQRKEKAVQLFESLPGFGDSDAARQAGGAESLYPAFEETLKKLISRKTLLYPLDRRLLLGLDVIETRDGYRVNVMSAGEPAA